MLILNFLKVRSVELSQICFTMIVFMKSNAIFELIDLFLLDLYPLNLCNPLECMIKVICRRIQCCELLLIFKLAAKEQSAYTTIYFLPNGYEILIIYTISSFAAGTGKHIRIKPLLGIASHFGLNLNLIFAWANYLKSHNFRKDMLPSMAIQRREPFSVVLPLSNAQKFPNLHP